MSAARRSRRRREKAARRMRNWSKMKAKPRSPCARLQFPSTCQRVSLYLLHQLRCCIWRKSRRLWDLLDSESTERYQFQFPAARIRSVWGNFVLTSSDGERRERWAMTKHQRQPAEFNFAVVDFSKLSHVVLVIPTTTRHPKLRIDKTKSPRSFIEIWFDSSSLLSNLWRAGNIRTSSDVGNRNTIYLAPTSERNRDCRAAWLSDLLWEGKKKPHRKRKIGYWSFAKA